MMDEVGIRVSLKLDAMETTENLRKQINKLDIEPISVGLKLDPNKVDLSALSKVDFTEIKRKFQDAFSVDGSVVGDLKDTMGSIERILNTSVSSKNIEKFKELSGALSTLGESFKVDTKVFNQFEKINDTLTKFNQLSKETQKALTTANPNRKFTGNLDDISNEVDKKFGVSSKQLSESVKKGAEELSKSFDKIVDTQIKSATKYLDVQDGITDVIKRKYNEWTDLTTTIFTDGTQLGKLTANPETYLKKIESQYKSVTDNIRKYNIDLHKAISEGEIADIEKYESIIRDYEALKRKMLTDVGSSPFADRIASEISQIDVLSRKMQDLAISQYDRGVSEKEQKEYLEKVQRYANEIKRLNNEVANAERDGLGDYAKSLVADMNKARGELSKLLNVSIKDIFPDDITARTQLKRKATDIIEAMDDANNLYNAKIDEKRNKKLQDTGLNEFLAKYKANINEIVALENKLSTALNGGQLDYASDLQSRIADLNQQQEELKKNASALASYKKAMESVAEVEEKARKNTELHNSYLKNKNKLQQQQADEKAEEKRAKEENKKHQNELKKIQDKQKQYWEDMLKYEDIISKGYKQVTETLTTKQNQYIDAIANDSIDKAKGLKESIEYWKAQKDALLREINNGKFTTDFYDNIKDIDKRNDLNVGEFEGVLSDSLRKQALKDLVNDYSKNAKLISKLKNEMLSVDEDSKTQKEIESRLKALRSEQEGIMESIQEYENYGNALDRINKLQKQLDANNKLAEAKNVDKVAKETGKTEEDILNKITKERERLSKLVEEEQTSVIDTYEKYAKLVSGAEKQYLSAVVKNDNATAEALEKVIDRYSKLKNEIVAQINEQGLDKLFKNRLDNIDKDINLDFNVHEGKISDSLEKDRLKKESQALKNLVADYRKNANEISKYKKELLSAEEGSKTYEVADSNIKRLEAEQQNIRDSIKAYNDYANTLKRIDDIQRQINRNNELAEAKNVDKTAKETGKTEEEILNKISKERENLAKLIEKEQVTVIDTYEKYAKLVSGAEKDYLSAVINDDNATAEALEKVIDRYKDIRNNLLQQINDKGLDTLFKDRLNNINKDIDLDLNVHSGKVSDKQAKKQLKEDAKALKEYIGEYDKLSKQIVEEQLKSSKYSQKGENIKAQAHKDNLARLKEELEAHKQTIDALAKKEKALEEVAKIDKYYDNRLELGMADVNQDIQISTFKEFKKLQDELVSRYKQLYQEKEKFEKAISTAVDSTAYEKLKTDLGEVENKLREVRSQITSQDHLGKIELFDANRVTAQGREVTQSITKIKAEAQSMIATVNELKNSEFVDKSSLALLEVHLNKLANANLDVTQDEVRQLNTQLTETKNLLSHLQGGIDNRIFQSNKAIELDKINDAIAKFKKDFKGAFDDASFEALEDSARRLANIMDKDSFGQGAKELTAQLKHARNQMNGLVRESNKYNFFEDLYTNMRTYQLGDLIVDGIQTALYSVKDIVVSMDSAMANVKKVANPIDVNTFEKLESIKSQAISIAKEVGMASEDVINSISDTIQSGGYAMEEAVEIARQTMMLANVGEMTAESATKGVVSMLAGFKLDPLKQMQVEVDGVTKKTNELTNAMDMVNHVG